MKKAMTRIKTSLTNNVDLKIFAVVIAAILWLAVVNISDPEKSVTIYNVPVTMTDESAITDMGMVYEVETNPYVSVTVSGKRSIVSHLTTDDFHATASLKELSKVNAVPVEVELKNKSIARNVTISKQSVQTLTVSVENVEKQDYNIEVEFSGTADDGYVAGSYSLSKNTVTVKAPTSVHDRIARVVATCSIEGKNSDVSRRCRLVLYDKHNRKIEGENISLSDQKVRVYVAILKEKEVPIDFDKELLGAPAEGYQVTEISLSQDTVKLVGTEELLGTVERLEVTQNLDISNETATVTKTVDLSDYLPNGVSVNGDKTVEITIKIDKLVTKTYNIETSGMMIQNLAEGLNLTYVTKFLQVTLRGDSAVMEQLSETDIQASIDLSGYGKGTATVPVSLTMPDGVEVTGQISVKVKIK